MSTPPDQPPILYRRRTVLFLIFVAAGALTIPIIWRSPAFSRNEKVFWTIVAACYTTLAFTLLIVYAVYMYQVTVGRLDVEIY